MEENNMPKFIDDHMPVKTPTSENSEFDVVPRLAWIGGGLMLAALVVVLIGFLLRTVGLWSDNISGSILAITCVLLMLSISVLMHPAYRLLLKVIGWK